MDRGRNGTASQQRQNRETKTSRQQKLQSEHQHRMEINEQAGLRKRRYEFVTISPVVDEREKLRMLDPSQKERLLRSQD